MRILLLSNGHGEDVMAAAVGLELRSRGATVGAVPLIGTGRAYVRAGIDASGPRMELPSGGYTLRGPRRFFADVRSGLLPATLGGWRAARTESATADATFVVGDPYAISVATAFTRAPIYYLPSAVSVLGWPRHAAPWHQPYGPMERQLMRRSRSVYARDEASADWLRARGVSNVSSLGNPMLDALSGDATPDENGPYLLLLPGTRDDRWFSLPRMLEAVGRLSDLHLQPVVAWSGEAAPPDVPGWRLVPTGRSVGTVAVYRAANGGGDPDGASTPTVAVTRGSFGFVLRRSRVALSTSGTAAEQCAGMGVPVAGFVTQGPQYTAEFARGQKRALGEALELSAPVPEAISSAIRLLDTDESRRERAREAGRRAMGMPGAAGRIADDVVLDLRRRLSATLGTR